MLGVTAGAGSLFSVMAGAGRPPTSFLYASDKSVGGRAKPGHDTFGCHLAQLAGDGWQPCAANILEFADMTTEEITVTPGPPAADVVEIWTDGGSKPNPGPGGWGAILRFKGHERELSGGEAATTNNRMELTAAAAALEALTRPCRVVLHTDSEYVKNGVTRWHQGWVRKNWRSSTGEPVKNMDLWQRLLTAAKQHRIEWRWVRGHSGDPMNERADALATAARKAIRH